MNDAPLADMPPVAIQEAFDLAVRCHRAGRLQQAGRIYRQVLARQPAHAEALHLLGVIAHQIGRNDIAVDLIGQSIALNPNNPDACSNLGMALKERGEIDEAIAAFHRAIGLKPDHPEIHYNLGVALREKGEFDEAIAAFRKAIAFNPDFAKAYYNLGVSLSALGQNDEAILAFRKATGLHPNFSEACCELGVALDRAGQQDEAVAAFRQAISSKQDFPEAHYRLGAALNGSGRLQEAIAAYRQAIALQPDFPEACNSLGMALRNAGKFEEAAACFRRALSISPAPRYYTGLVSTGRQVIGAAEVGQLTGLAHQPDLPVDDRIAAGFALGKWMDEAGRFDEAFVHFAAANRLFKESRESEGEGFDPEELRHMVDLTIQKFSSELFAGERTSGNASELPVFIVGMPRSGTSLVEQIAASHPSVFGAGELETISRLCMAMHGGGYPAEGKKVGWAVPRILNPESIARASASYLETVRSLGGGTARVTDKAPGNVFHLGLIALLFPCARVVICRRDARDNCLSSYFTHFANTSLLYSYDLPDCGQQYLETDRLIAHWRKTLPLKILEMQYEALVADPGNQARRLIDFLGLPWAPACLEFHRTDRPVFTASAWQVRQPIYSQSVGRWRHYEKHLAPLFEVLGGQY